MGSNASCSVGNWEQRGISDLTLSPAFLETGSSSSLQGQCCQTLPECVHWMEQESLRLNLCAQGGLLSNTTRYNREQMHPGWGSQNPPLDQSSPTPPQQQIQTSTGDQQFWECWSLCNQVIKGLLICSQLQVQSAAFDWPITATEHKGDTAKKVTKCSHLARNCSERTKDFTSFTENKERRKVERK